jgi:hypothetical protein
MEFSYDKYIILACNNNLRCTYEAYLEVKSGLSLLQQLASTTNATFKHRGEIMLKPLKQLEAQKVLENLNRGKYDRKFSKVLSLSRY